MNIRIKSLSLTNFKCFRSKEFEFGEDIVTIRGRNGVGKTTIFDAILFCLFGKNSQDQTKFNIKTLDENGNVIPHLDHSVEMTLHVFPSDGSDVRVITIKHSVKEEWKKKRGESEEVFAGDTHEYLVNGELITAKDYKAYIASLIDEQTFRILTNPQYFPSLKWQDQRTILTQMVGSINPEVIATTDDLKALAHTLDVEGEDIIAYKKHLGYQIKQVKEKLDKIPIRLEEQHKALPERLDWDNIQTSLNNKQALLKGVESDILSIKQGNGSDLWREETRKLLEEAQKKFDAFDDKAHEEYNAEYRDKQEKINEASIKFNEAVGNQRLMEQTIEADKKMIERCKESLADCDKQLQKLREEWPTQKFEVDPNAGFCPTCGQSLPADVVEGKIEVMRQEFNQRKEAKKKELNERASIIKKNKADSEEEIKRLEEKLAADEKSLEEIKESINTIFSKKAKLEKLIIIPPANRIAANEEAIGLYKQIKGMKQQLNAAVNPHVDSEKLNELESTKEQLKADISNLTQQLASRIQYAKILGLIDGINEEQKDLVKQLSGLEKKEDIAREYEDRQNELLESRVNEHFTITRWKMFRTVVNGGDYYNEPWCECYDLNGTAYHDGLNQAARLNIGLDICNAMAKVYNVSAPVVIDQSESTLDILPTCGQQIRLEVFDSDLTLV